MKSIYLITLLILFTLVMSLPVDYYTADDGQVVYVKAGTGCDEGNSNDGKSVSEPSIIILIISGLIGGAAYHIINKRKKNK